MLIRLLLLLLLGLLLGALGRLLWLRLSPRGRRNLGLGLFTAVVLILVGAALVGRLSWLVPAMTAALPMLRRLSNFYTVTIYEKGAEVVGMLKTLVGEAGFRKGTDLYFDRHDGQAVTTDDFVKAIEDVNDIDLSQFKRWYSQAGTPKLDIHTDYDIVKQQYTITVQQHCDPTPDQQQKLPFHIPLSVGLLDQQGKSLPLQ